MLGKAELGAESAHLVLVEVSKGFDDLALSSELSDESRVVVVRLDHVRLGARKVRAALDEVRAKSPLRQVDVVGTNPQLAHRLLSNAHEGVPNDHPLVLGSHCLFQGPNLHSLRHRLRLGELLGAVNHVEIDTDLAQGFLAERVKGEKAEGDSSSSTGR
eukprot:655953-Hanusia_phi.AAC.2